MRKRFRAEKKAEQARAEADRSLNEKYGLPAELALERVDDAGAASEAQDDWTCARAERAPEDARWKRKLAPGAPVLLPAPPRWSLASSEPAPPPSSAALSLHREKPTMQIASNLLSVLRNCKYVLISAN